MSGFQTAPLPAECLSLKFNGKEKVLAWLKKAQARGGLYAIAEEEMVILTAHRELAESLKVRHAEL